MYTLQRDNVVKLTDSEVKRDKYISEGYKLIREPVEEKAEPNEDSPGTGTPDTGKSKGKGKPDV